MFTALRWLQIGAGAAAGALIAGSLAYNIGHWRGDDAGYDRRVAEVAAADGRATLERKRDDAALQRMSDYDLCVSNLRAQRMPVDACEQLRGLRGE